MDTWEATPEEMEPYRDHVGEQDSYENRPNVAGIRRGSGDGRSILLNAHIDTVDPGDPAAWKGDPLSGTVEGDLLYGRGSCDMKGGLVTHLVALDALADLGLGLRRRRHRGGHGGGGERGARRPLDRPARVPRRRRPHHRADPSARSCRPRAVRSSSG